MNDRTDLPPESVSLDSHGNRERQTAAAHIPRRRVLAAVATAGNVALAGCLSVGPEVEAHGLANSLVFNDVTAAETVSVGGNRLTASVELKPAAFDRLGVAEVVVWTERARPFSASEAETLSGSVRTQTQVPVELPAGDPATISALDEHGTAVESIRVTNDATIILAGLGAKARQRRILLEQITMPAEILTTSFEKRRTEFSTNAWMTGEITNTARDAEIPYLAVEATFTNAADKVVDKSISSIEGLGSGEVWEAVVPVYGDASDATTGKLTITESTAGRTPVPPTNVTLLEARLEQPDEDLEPPAVIGKLRNTGTTELNFLEASAKFYAENGNVLGDNAVTVTGLNSGQTWSFEISFYAHSSERAERVEEYELSLVA